MVWRNTGSMYFNGIYYSKDEKRAFELYKLAAYEDVPIAQFQLGKMYEYGLGVEISHKMALIEYCAAASHGISEPMDSLGRLYFQGTVLMTDLQKSFGWYLKAAQKGNPHAEGMVGIMYLFGMGTKKSKGDATLWLTKTSKDSDSATLAAFKNAIESVVKRAQNAGAPTAESQQDAVLELTRSGTP